MKFRFSTADAANDFIAYNHDLIVSQHGVAPVRSYYCKACNCYHVTSQSIDARKVVRANDPNTSYDNAKIRMIERNMHRDANRIERLLRRAYKCIAMLQLGDAKCLCNKAIDLYERNLNYSTLSLQLQRVFIRLTECVNRLQAEECRLQSSLLKVENYGRTEGNRQPPFVIYYKIYV